jgi:transcriptional regulator with XRE-family HTH domain
LGQRKVHVGDRISVARKEAGMTQAQLASVLGESQPTVSYVERKSWVRRSVLEKYARALGRPLSYFLQEAEEGSAHPGSREKVIEQAFDVLRRDPDFQFAARDDSGLTLEAKTDIVRLYEQARHVALLPEGFD